MRNMLKKGLTLVELVVSISIFSLVIVSVFSVYGFSVVETYKQSKGMSSHINSIAHVESQDNETMMNVDVEKSIHLFEGLATDAKPILGRGISSKIVADNYNNGYVVSISTPESSLGYEDSELGRVGPRFASILLPQEALQGLKKVYPEEYRDKMAAYFVDEGDNKIGSERHMQFNFSKYNLPKGNYQVRFLVYKFEKYGDILLDNASIYNKFKEASDLNFGAEITKKIPLSKKSKSIFVASNNTAYVDESIMEKNNALIVPITKHLADHNKNWSLFDKDNDKILGAGKYMFVFELTLDKLQNGESESQSLMSFKKLKHLSDVTKISDLSNHKRLIARDIIPMESLESNIFVSTEDSVYIGSNFEQYNLTKNLIGRSGEIEYFGALPSAKHYINGQEYSYPGVGFILNRSDNGLSYVYKLSPLDASKLARDSKGEVYIALNKQLSRFSSSLSPYSRHGKPGATFIVEKNTGKLLHIDKRYHEFSDNYRDENRNYMDGNVYVKNNRLFDASTLNIALLHDGRIFMTDSWMYRPLFGTKRRYYEIHRPDTYSDFYVDLGYNSNAPSTHYIGLSGNHLKKIITKYQVENGYDLENVEYVYFKHKGVSDELERASYKDAIQNDLKDYKFERIIPISQDQYLILAQKKGIYKLLRLTKDVFTKKVNASIDSSVSASTTVTHYRHADSHELDSEKEAFVEEVKTKLKNNLKLQVNQIAKNKIDLFKKKLKEEVLPHAKIREEYVVQAIDRIVDSSCDKLIMDTLQDKTVNVDEYFVLKVGVKGLQTRPQTVGHSINLDLKIDDTLEISEYSISETRYPEFDINSAHSIIKEMAININDLKFEYYGNDLYVYYGNKLYKLPPKVENTIKDPELILKADKKIKNVYIHDKSKFIEIK